MERKNSEAIARNPAPHVKLRAACSQCCTAKVKCSGEKNGCERCRTMGVDCIYLESRVGKVPGIRAKKTPAVVGAEPSKRQRQMSLSAMTRDTSSPSSSGAPTDKDKDLDQRDAEDTIWWSPEWGPSPSQNIIGNKATELSAHHAQYTASEGNPPSFDSLTAFSAADEFPLAGLTGDFGIAIGPQSPPATGNNPRAESPAYQEAMLPPGLRLRTETDSHCCQDCCHIIIELEKFINLELKDAKIVVGILKQAIEKVAHLVALQQGFSNLRCLMLFSNLLYQISELFETGLSAMATEQARQQARSLTSRSMGFGLGGFSFGVEEQCSYLTQAFREAIRKTMDIVGKLEAMLGMSLGETSTGPAALHSPQSKAVADCYVELELQFSALAHRVSERAEA